MEKFKMNLNKKLELINFVKLDDQANLCVLYDNETKEFIVAWDLIIYKVISYKQYGCYKARWKAEKELHKLNEDYLIQKSKKESEEYEKRRLWEQSKI